MISWGDEVDKFSSKGYVAHVLLSNVCPIGENLSTSLPTGNLNFDLLKDDVFCLSMYSYKLIYIIIATLYSCIISFFMFSNHIFGLFSLFEDFMHMEQIPVFVSSYIQYNHENQKSLLCNHEKSITISESYRIKAHKVPNYSILLVCNPSFYVLYF